MHGQQNVTKTQ